MEFYQHILQKHQAVQDIPNNKLIYAWANELLQLLFPQRQQGCLSKVEEIKQAFDQLETQLYELLEKTKACDHCDNRKISQEFFLKLPSVYQTLLTDAQAILDGDPAARNLDEVVRTYPGFFAISFYRLAHELWLARVPLIPRILTEYAHGKTGIDIHPGAEIGEYLHIDHGTGIVIGETCIIGRHVKLYQGVTLGALSVEKKFAGKQRHPIIEDGVIVYAGATILGGETRVGHHSVIGGNVWLTSSIEPYTTVYHQTNSKFIDSKPIV